ncbi:MAG: hypothetical protein ACRCWI_03890 [Brevinema sp.]
MENFRPPAMDEVETQKRKKRTLITTIIIITILLVSLGTYFGIRKLKIYFNYLLVEEKHQLLGNYYTALIKKDLETLQQIAPDFQLGNQYNFVTVSGDYSLFIFPEVSTNKNKLIFTIIDHSITPNVSYLKEVIYTEDENQNKAIIQYINELGTGRQID